LNFKKRKEKKEIKIVLRHFKTEDYNRESAYSCST
jgi:hypothetical protein